MDMIFNGGRFAAPSMLSNLPPPPPEIDSLPSPRAQDHAQEFGNPMGGQDRQSPTPWKGGSDHPPPSTPPLVLANHPSGNSLGRSSSGTSPSRRGVQLAGSWTGGYPKKMPKKSRMQLSRNFSAAILGGEIPKTTQKAILSFIPKIFGSTNPPPTKGPILQQML